MIEEMGVEIGHPTPARNRSLGSGKIRRIGFGPGCGKKIRFGSGYDCIPGPDPVTTVMTQNFGNFIFTIISM